MHTAKDLAIKEGWYLIPISDEFSHSVDDKLSVYIPKLSSNIEIFIHV